MEYKHSASAKKMNVPAAEKPAYSVANSLVSYYLLLMFSFFSLFLTDQYSHARTDKLWFFLILSGVLVVAATVSALVNRAEQQRSGVASPLLTPLYVPDVMFLCFFGFAAISTILSKYPAESLTGSLGRNNGLILLLAYTLVYFVLTRLYVYKDYVLVIFLLFSCVIALLTVLNFFFIDPFGLLNGYEPDVAADFGSTLGNKNTIASYMCLFLPVALMLLSLSEKRYLQAVSAVATAFASAGMICANSMSGLLGLAVILPVCAAFAARSYDSLRRYVLGVLILLGAGKIVMLGAWISGANKGFEYMQEFLIASPLVYIPIALLAGLYLLMRLLKGDRYPRKAVQGVLIALCILIPLIMLGSVLYFTLIDTQTKLGRLTRILRINNKWGTHRGYMWIKCLEEFGKFDIVKKLFGSGPDTLYKVLEPWFDELLRRYGNSSTDCAHNELLNYLVTQGIFGLASYLGLVATIVARGIRTARKHPLALVFCAAVICYFAQSVVNLYSPIVTPLFFIFLALTEALNRQRNSNKALTI